MSADLSFPSFFEDWLVRQEDFLRQLESLISAIDEVERSHECNELISRVISHYQEFYREKARAAAEDAFLLMSPPWLSSFERSLLWLSGFRPSILFRIVDTSVSEELTAEQRRRIEAIKAETRRKEQEISQVMARVQEAMADQPVYGLMRTFRGLVDGERAVMEEALEKMKAAMLDVVGSADALQGWSAAAVLAALRPAQGVKVLAAVARFQLHVRKWGLERDSRRGRED